jgi:ATP-binding cassette subfamily C (CFTR/MRP) protein 1
MASRSHECEDDTFGPLVRSCARHADFTLLFEQSILAIPCDALFLLLAPWRIAVLWKARRTTKMGQKGPAKQIIGVAWALLQVLLFVWSRGDGALVTRASIPSATLGLAAALIYLPLSYFEHGRTVRPSTLINVYLAASLLLGLPQARTLFSITSQWHLKATYMSVLIAKGLLLLLEAWEKRASLHDQYQSLPVESTSGILNKILFLWINELFKRGYSRLMDVDDLGTIDKSLHSASLLGNVELAWSKRSESHTWPLIKTLAWSLRWSILAPVPPRLCYSAFLFAQPFLIKRATSYLEQNPASDQAENIGYGLIGATACIYIGIAV